MQQIRRLIGWALQVLALLIAAPAIAAPTNITAELIAERPVAPGETATLAIAMRPATGWHGYWSNPGDAGLGMTLDWTLPAGASAGTPSYPVPEVLLMSGLMNHVYEHDYAVLVPLTVPRDARPGAVLPVRVKASWLACTDKICVPESGELATTVTIGAGPADPRFDAWRQALPAPLGAPARFALTGTLLRLAIPLPASLAVEDPHLFLAEDKVVAYAAKQVFSRDGDLLIIEVPRAGFEPASPQQVNGVLRLNGAGDGVTIVADPGAVPRAGAPLAQAGPAPDIALPTLLLMALAGGLLLNIMPCVFPILSLKALSLARAGESEAQARAEGLAYTAGVVLACLALGALLLGLRAAGQEVGWAFQLQEPLVVAGLLLLAVAITANLLGLYEFAVPGFATAGSPQGAFATGLLAAFVATPCTGPFMAAAMGAALLLPTASALALFGALGLGIALPFLAIAWIPALRRRLPKPGPWMARFRRWMALPMGLTALALVWLGWRLGGGWLLLVVAASSLGLVGTLRAIGRDQAASQPVRKRLWADLAFVCLIAFVGFYAFTQDRGTAASASSGSIIDAAPFSEAALATARASGKPVFVYFTADWCLTCKVNEASTIETQATRTAFTKAGVTVLRGDWTRRDPAITRFLTEHGAAGVPLYLWYPAGGGTPQQLPQILTPNSLVELAGR